VLYDGRRTHCSAVVVQQPLQRICTRSSA